MQLRIPTSTPVMRIPRILPLLATAGLFALTACQQVPVTGRSQLNLVDDADIRKKSIEQFEEMKKKFPVSKNREHIARVQRVGQRLSRVAFWDVPNADWEFVVFEQPNTINAFAMPGGKVGVFSGLFKITANDDQLASVLAHEISHVAARHSHERFSQMMIAQTGTVAATGALIASGTGGYAANAVLDGYGRVSGVVVTAYDRDKEKEADHIGMIYMARAGYNPEEAIKVMEQLEQATANKPKPPAWFSTHPSHPERILRMMDIMPKALEAYAQSKPQAVSPTPGKQ